jgi:hypothetical protein
MIRQGSFAVARIPVTKQQKVTAMENRQKEHIVQLRIAFGERQILPVSLLLCVQQPRAAS